MVDAFVTARGLGKSFGKHTVFEGLDFSINPGDVVGLLGKNGAGKTTLLELMLGFTPTTDGNIQVFGYDSFRLPGSAKTRIGFVPQKDELIDQLTVADQTRLIGSFYKQWDQALMDRLIGSWGIDPTAQVRTLSVGQRQKLSILLSLGHRPDLLILDEPVASLDPLARRDFLEQIVEVSATGDRAVVLSSHIVSDVERLANRIWILRDSHLYWCGDIDDLKTSVVRLHLRSARRLPPELQVPNAISVEVGASHATAVVHSWADGNEKEIAALTGGSLEVESLTLEDIFLELHR